MTMTHEQAVGTLASERYLLEEMSDAERSTFEEHYFSCEECAGDVRAGGLMRDGARAGLMHAATRSNVIRGRWYQSSAIPWAAAAALAVVAGYQALVPGLNFNQPMALEPVTLRPASRGQEARVPIVRDTSVVTFALDVSAAVPGGELSYVIRTAAGTAVASGRLGAPRPGAPLLLLVPAPQIGAPGRYILAIADSEYPFEVVTQ